MGKKGLFYLIVILGFVSLFLSCEKRTVIARVGNYKIYADELVELRESSRAPSETFQDLMAHVNSLVDDKLRLCDAVQSNIDQDSTVVSRVESFEKGKVYSYIVNKEVVDKIITNSMLKKRYRLLSKEWHVRHILLPFSQDSVATIEKLKSIRSRILKGEDFGDLAREFSQDIKSAGKKGDLGFITYDPKKWDERFLGVVASMPIGRVSDVVRTKQGYHLVFVQRVRDVDLPLFKEKLTDLRNELIRENIPKLDSAFYKFRDDINERYHAEQLSDNIDSLLVLIQKVEADHVDDKVNLQRDPRQFKEKLTEEQAKFTLATYDGGEYTLNDLLTTYNEISPMRRPLLNNKPAVVEFLNRNVPRKLMIRYGYEKGIDRNRELRKEVEKEKERQMISRVRRIKIDAHTTPTEEELLAIYNENPHLYEDDVRVKVQEILVADPDTAMKVYDKAMAGADFDALARQYNEREDTKAQNGVLDYLSMRDYGMVSRKAVQMKAGEISEPIRNRKVYSIIKVLDRKASGVKPFDEVRLRIRRTEKIRKRDELTEEWMASLKEKYKVAIYEDVIKREFEKMDE